MAKIIAIYTRVSTIQQTEAAQLADLHKYEMEIISGGGRVVWFRDKSTGTNMHRPELDKLMQLARMGDIDRVVIWRLDRLGRTSRGVITLVEELVDLGVGFVSLRENFDPRTITGRLIMTILSSVAQFEVEVKSERQRAAIEWIRGQSQSIHELKNEGRSDEEIARRLDMKPSMVARILGRKPGSLPWGGRKRGAITKKLTEQKFVDLVRRGLSYVEIAKICNVSLKTVSRRAYKLGGREQIMASVASVAS